MGNNIHVLQSTHLLKPELGLPEKVSKQKGTSCVYPVLNKAFPIQAIVETFRLTRQQPTDYLIQRCKRRSQLSDTLHCLVPILYYRVVQEMCGSQLQILYEYLPSTLEDVLSLPYGQTSRRKNKEFSSLFLTESQILRIAKAVVRAVLALDRAGLGWSWIQPSDIKRRARVSTRPNTIISNHSLSSQSSIEQVHSVEWEWLIMHSPLGLSCSVGQLGPNLQQILQYCMMNQDMAGHKREIYSDKMQAFRQRCCYYETKQIKHILDTWHQTDRLPVIQLVPRLNSIDLKKRSMKLRY